MDTGATNLDADLIIEAVATCVRQVLESPDNEEYLQLQAAPEQPAVPLHGAEGETSCRPVGRMKKDIDMDFVCDLLFELHMPLTKVAALCQVSRPTLYKRLRDEGIDTSCSRFTDISEEDLERHVREIKGHHPNAGLVYLTGHLRSRGVFVQRQKVIDMLHRVDPVGVAERLKVAIARRVYSVPCPNFLWHLDGHHKLINWKLVIHACVDGFSRTIIYLYCADNNRSDTVEKLFCESTQLFGWPFHVRTDYGGENVKVWAAMENHRQQERSVIVGSSVHNSRVERMHLDVKIQVVETFKSVFLDMEEKGILCRDNDVDLFCLHYVFLPKINRALQEFRAGHNNHSLRTEHNQTPLQLFYANEDLIAQHEHDHELHHDDSPGLSARQLLESGCDLPFVPVESVRCPLSNAEVEQMQQQINPLGSNDARQTFLDVTQFVRDCTVRRVNP